VVVERVVGLAIVGDTPQPMPVGQLGAVGSAVRAANAAVELDTIHRFHSPEYAALVLVVGAPRVGCRTGV
jgi:hypothetical protein